MESSNVQKEMPLLRADANLLLSGTCSPDLGLLARGEIQGPRDLSGCPRTPTDHAAAYSTAVSPNRFCAESRPL